MLSTKKIGSSGGDHYNLWPLPSPEIPVCCLVSVVAGPHITWSLVKLDKNKSDMALKLFV